MWANPEVIDRLTIGDIKQVLKEIHLGNKNLMDLNPM
jgi:hypothetical protein